MIIIAAAFVAAAGCDTGKPVDASADTHTFYSDAAVFSYITQQDPLQSYTLFPFADSVVAGTLNGSSAHRPLVRVSLNGHAIASLSGGRFPSGGAFRDSSVVLKEIKDAGGATTLYAVAVKQQGNPLAANGWLWAEYQRDGSVFYSIENKGSGCISCHSLDQGPQHDFIRTFGRQSP